MPDTHFGALTCRKLIESWYGYDLVTNPNETIVSVLTTATQLVARNGSRIMLTVSNNSGSVVNIARQAATLANGGLQITPGGWVQLTWKDDGELPADSWFAIAIGTAGNVYIREDVLITRPY